MSVKTTSIDGRVEVVTASGIRVAISGLDASDNPLEVGSDGTIIVDRANSIRVVASGLQPDSQYGVIMFSDPVQLGKGRTSITGEVLATVKLPSDVDAGRHTLQLNAVDKDDNLVSISTPIEVRGNDSSPIGPAVYVTLIAALIAAVFIPTTVRRRRG